MYFFLLLNLLSLYVIQQLQIVFINTKLIENMLECMHSTGRPIFIIFFIYKYSLLYRGI